MEKSLAQSTISKNIPLPVSSSSESEDDCDNKCKKPRKYNIRAFQENWKMEYLLSPIPVYLMVLSHSVWSDMKFWAKIGRTALRGIICQNMQRVLKTNFQSTAMNEKKYIITQELKLKQ